MRLTVRTLLAWLDEVLGQAEHGELTAKVTASSVARPLIERIRSVVASPVLSAPPPAGRGLADDPNTAAEFLDNVLDGDRLAAFERVCIDSDIHLADVAASHRVLAELHRDPTALEPFAAASGRAALDAARRHGVMPTIEPVATRRSSAVPAMSPKAASSRGSPWWAWLSAAVALLLILALGGVLLVLTRGRGDRSSRDVAKAVAENIAEGVGPPPVAVAPPVQDPAAPAPAMVASPPAEEPRAVEPTLVASAPGDAVPPAPEATAAPVPAEPMEAPEAPLVASATPAPPRGSRTVPYGEAMAIGGGDEQAALPSPPPDAAPPADAAVSPAQTDAGAACRLVEGSLLLRAGEGNAWRSMAEAVAFDDAVDRFDALAPAGVSALLALDGVALRVHPGTRVIVSRRAETAPAIEIVHGRVVIEADAGDTWPLVRAGGLHGELGLVPGQRAGVEVAFARPRGGPPGSAELARVAIFSAGSAVVWRQTPATVAPQQVVGLPAEILLPAATALRWAARDPVAARPEPCPAPPWIGEITPPAADRLARAAAAAVVAGLAAAPAEGAVDALRRLAAGGLPETRGAAAATLAFLGEPADLVDLLCEAPPRGLRERQWVDLEAATVPAVLSWGGPAAEALLAAFRERAPEGTAVMALGAALGDDAAAAATLVSGLDSDALVVRRYSILRLEELAAAAGRSPPVGYRADGDPAARREAAARWRSFIGQGPPRRRGVAEPAPPSAR